MLILMLEGVLRFGEDGVQKQLVGGEYYIQRAGKRQDGEIASDSPHYFYIHLDASFTDGDGLPESGRWEKKRILPLVERLDALQKSGANYLQKSMALLAIINELNEAQRAVPNELAVRIRTEITERAFSGVKIKDIASALFVSVNYAIRVFSCEYGVTPHQYLAELRLSEAKILLRDTARTEEEIASAVGYGDFSVFYKAFRARYGASPSEFRKRKNVTPWS